MGGGVRVWWISAIAVATAIWEHFPVYTIKKGDHTVGGGDLP
jgi:hypothetical protein